MILFLSFVSCCAKWEGNIGDLSVESSEASSSLDAELPEGNFPKVSGEPNKISLPKLPPLQKFTGLNKPEMLLKGAKAVNFVQSKWNKPKILSSDWKQPKFMTSEWKRKRAF